MEQIKLICTNSDCEKSKTGYTQCVICQEPLSDFLILNSIKYCGLDCMTKLYKDWYGKELPTGAKRRSCSIECSKIQKQDWDVVKQVKQRVMEARKKCFYCSAERGVGAGKVKRLSVWPVKTLSKQEETDPNQYRVVCTPCGFKNLIKTYKTSQP